MVRIRISKPPYRATFWRSPGQLCPKARESGSKELRQRAQYAAAIRASQATARAETSRRRCVTGCPERLPNGLRLSCGAESEFSQTEFYYTACRNVRRLIEDGRRQLEA